MTEEIKTEHPGVYRLTNGGWRVRALITNPETGRREKKRRTLPASATVEEAIAMRARLVAEIRGEEAQPAPRPLLAEYAEGWIERRERRLKPSTESMYRGVLSGYLLPFLGDLYCEELRRSDVEEYARWLEEQTRDDTGDPLAHATLKGIWNVSKILLKDLAADHTLPDPTRRITSPRSKRRGVRSRETLSLEQLGALVAYVQERWPRRYAEICTLAYTGIRSGELWALAPDSLEGQVLRVEASISDGVWTDETKTGWGREVYAPHVVREAITAHRRWMLERQHPGLDSGLLFPTRSGRPRTRGSLRNALGDAVEQLDLPHVSPQVLRRTYNTLMLNAQVDRIVLRSQIGHTDEAMTEHYAGVRIETKRDAFESVFEIGGVT